jgi:hypothetical protein
LREAGAETDAEGKPATPVAPAVRLTAADRALRQIPAEQLAAELQRRGWIVVEP